MSDTEFPRVIWQDEKSRVVQCSAKDVRTETRRNDSMGQVQWHCTLGPDHDRDILAIALLAMFELQQRLLLSCPTL